MFHFINENINPVKQKGLNLADLNIIIVHEMVKNDHLL